MTTVSINSYGHQVKIPSSPDALKQQLYVDAKATKTRKSDKAQKKAISSSKNKEDPDDGVNTDNILESPLGQTTTSKPAPFCVEKDEWKYCRIYQDHQCNSQHYNLSHSTIADVDQ